MAEATDSYGTYHYAMDNPVMLNDPMGDTAPAKATVTQFLQQFVDLVNQRGQSMSFQRDGGGNAWLANDGIRYIFSDRASDFDEGGGGGGDSGKAPAGEPRANQSGTGPGGEGAPNSAFTMRDNNVTWSTLFREFRSGTGPTYSGFGANHPMTQALKNSYVVQLAAVEFMLKGGKKPLVNFDVPYGAIGVPMSGANMTEQFLGGVRISIYPSQLGYIYILNNTTDRYSGGYHMMNSVPRDPKSVTPYGTIYQRFMWIVK